MLDEFGTCDDISMRKLSPERNAPYGLPCDRISGRSFRVVSRRLFFFRTIAAATQAGFSESSTTKKKRMKIELGDEINKFSLSSNGRKIRKI